LNFSRLLEVGEHNPLSRLRRDIESLGFTYALLDSRTGMTEIAATCTLGLADVVVMLTGLNNQNLQGTRWVLDMLENEGGLRPDDIIVVFSPVPEAEEELKAERLQRARYIVGDRDVLLLPYHPRLALVEELFVKEWKETSLAQKYRYLASKISQRNPDDIEGIIMEGIRLLLQDAKIDEVEETFDKALQINSTDGEANFYAGQIAYIQERYEDAERYYRRSIEADEKVSTPWRSLGNLLAAQDRFEEALHCWHRVVELYPDDAKTYFSCGNALIGLAERRDDESLLEQAIQGHKLALNLKEGEPAFHNNLADLLIQIGEYEEAEEHCLRALELKEHDFATHGTYGELLLKTGRLEEAEKHFLRSLELKEDEPGTHEDYAQLLRQMGRSEEAEEHERRAQEVRS